MFTASKYEEIYSPSVKDYVYVTDKAYSVTEVLDIEGRIINILEFNIQSMSSHRFFETFNEIFCSFEKKALTFG